MKLSQIFFKGIQFSINTGIKSFERKTVIRLVEHIKTIEEEQALLLKQIENEIEGHNPVVIPGTSGENELIS